MISYSNISKFVKNLKKNDQLINFFLDLRSLKIVNDDAIVRIIRSGFAQPSSLIKRANSFLNFYDSASIRKKSSDELTKFVTKRILVNGNDESVNKIDTNRRGKKIYKNKLPFPQIYDFKLLDGIVTPFRRDNNGGDLRHGKFNKKYVKHLFYGFETFKNYSSFLGKSHLRGNGTLGKTSLGSPFTEIILHSGLVKPNIANCMRPGSLNG